MTPLEFVELKWDPTIPGADNNLGLCAVLQLYRASVALLRRWTLVLLRREPEELNVTSRRGGAYDSFYLFNAK